MRCTVLTLIFLIAGIVPAHAEQARVVRAYGDHYGAVHIIRSDGKETIISKHRGATGVDDVKIAPDGQTVGWLIDWPNPEKYRSWETLPMTLAIWRKGKIIRMFDVDDIFYGWAFWNSAEQIAYNDGPLHGNTPNFELHDIATGRLIERFYDDDSVDPAKVPAWVNAIDESGK